MRVPLEISQKVGAILEGTSRSIESAMEEAGVEGEYSVDEMDEAIVTHCNLERCPECEWWVEAGELADGDGEETACASCRS